MDQAKPLTGCTVLVTRPGEDSGPMSQAFLDAGARAIDCPAIEFTSLAEENLGQIRGVLTELGVRRGWLVLPSPTAIRHFGAIVSRLRLARNEWAEVRMTTIGEASAAALAELGFAPEFLPPTPTAESLGESLPVDAGVPVLVLGSTISRPELRDGLARRGVMSQTLPLYAPRPCKEGLAALREALMAHHPAAGPILLLVASPSAVDAIGDFFSTEPQRLGGAGWVALGPTTHRRLLERGILEELVARAGQPRAESVIAAAVSLADSMRSGTDPCP